MSHREHHLEGSIKNLLAFENHAQTDGCPHCMTKHILAVEQLLTEEGQQRDGISSSLAKEAASIREALPSAYKGDLIAEERMAELERRARDIRLKLMREIGVPGHKHRTQEKVEHVVVS